ncbi:MAG TPA: TIGR00730 family Rossman fold protein [Candidatus Ozemobacteraceae bacterium]|nr:TIGR00730 family Rossman fold protein [Candidatus Ozemobacteraceae bacterium]
MTKHLKPSAICIYCASSADVSDRIRDEGRRVGTLLAENGLDLVYGGTTCGLMKVVADAHKTAGGRVIGIVPEFMLAHGIGNADGQDETVVVPDMAARKSKMIERSGGFIVLPGGMGTLDELFDTLVNKQLGRHAKPIVLMNTDGYYNPLISLLKHGIECRTIRAEHMSLFSVANTPEEAIRLLAESKVDEKSLKMRG